MAIIIRNRGIIMSSIESAHAMIEKLSIQHTWYFTGYIVFVLLSGLFTWLLWRSGNRLQDAIRHDANARIAEASLGAEQAKASAAKAHERAENLEHGNLTLRTQIATLEEQSKQ